MMVFIKSIRFKITILYMGILAITLTSFSVILYHNVSRGLYEHMDTLLVSKAGGIAQSVDAYWEAAKFEEAENAQVAEATKKRRNVNFAKAAQRWAQKESDDPALIDIIVQVFDTDGAIIASSKTAKDMPEISQKGFLPILQGKSKFYTTDSGDRAGRMTFRIFTTPVFESEKVAYIVQVASPLTSIQVALTNLRVALFILFPITVLLTGIMGAFLAKMTLKPVDHMIHTIHQITANNLELQLKVPSTKDEIQNLAETFNRMLTRLKEAFTSQRQLFEDLSHELKTPLTIMKGELEVALKKVRTPGDYESILKSSLEELNVLIKLSENLLFLARADSKEVMPQKRELDLNPLLQGVINSIRRLAELKHIAVSFDAPAAIRLYGDEDQLKTLFFNILDNAVKYTAENGAIGVRVVKDRSAVNIEIRDNGMGISGDDIPHIFDRFYRIDKSRNSAGFGLGLSIAKSIAEAHDGAISVESHTPGGTKFTVLIPIKKG